MSFMILCNLFVRVVDRGVGLCKADWNPATHKCGSFGPALARSLAVARSLACHHTTALGKSLFVNLQYWSYENLSGESIGLFKLKYSILIETR